MTRTIGRCCIALAILLASSSAWAQTDTEKIRARVKTGQKVLITDDAGQEVKGKISAMSADALTILGEGKSAEVPYGRIVRIDRPNDSLANGALIGLGAGVAVALGAIATEDDSQCPPEGFICDPPGRAYVAGTLVLGGLGAAVGVGIDALIHRDREIYRRGGGALATVAPVVGRGLRGGVVSLAW